MNRVKYITITNTVTETAIVFGEILNHSDVADAFKSLGYTVMGAGFVDSGGASCGQSITLKMGPSPKDDFLLKYSMPHVLETMW